MFGFGRGFGLRAKRNQPLTLGDPHPVPRLEDDQYSGNRFLDGYTRESRADPLRAGTPPPVIGGHGPAPMGPDDSFEQ